MFPYKTQNVHPMANKQNKATKEARDNILVNASTLYFSLFFFLSPNFFFFLGGGKPEVQKQTSTGTTTKQTTSSQRNKHIDVCTVTQYEDRRREIKNNNVNQETTELKL